MACWIKWIAAGQIKERFGKTSVLHRFCARDVRRTRGRGSGRSVAGFNMAALFMAGQRRRIGFKGAVCAMAAGFTVEPDKIEALEEFFTTEAERASWQA